MSGIAFLFAILFLFSACHPVSAPAGPGWPEPTGICGTVAHHDGSTPATAVVYAYRSPRGGMRGPADFEARIDAEGRYFLDLAEGNYYLVARARRGGADGGPPRPGDAWALYPRNPVVVLPGQQSRADFRLQRITQPRLLKAGALTGGTTGFSGRLVDAAGQPVAGAFVLAYRDGNLRRMPDLTSPAVGKDGLFTLYLPSGGSWCLAARSRSRGQPVAGELYGILEAATGGCLRLDDGQLLAVGDIVLRPYRP